MLLAALFGSSLYTYHYGPFLVFQTEQDRSLLPTAAALKARLKPTETSLLEGLGYDPMIPYYSERKAIMNHDPWKLADPQLARLLESLGPVSLGAVARCGQRKEDRAAMEKLLANIRFQASDMEDTGTCVVYFGHINRSMKASEFRLPAGALIASEADVAGVDGFSDYINLDGFAPLEGPYPNLHLPHMHWGTGPKSTLQITSRLGTVRLVLKALAYGPGQSIRVVLNGKDVLQHTFTQLGRFDTFSIPVVADGSETRIELIYKVWDPGTSKDPLARAVLFRCIQLVNDRRINQN